MRVRADVSWRSNSSKNDDAKLIEPEPVQYRITFLALVQLRS